MKQAGTSSASSAPSAWRDSLFIGSFALLRFLLNATAYQGYGYFRDELYYIDCARHLAWGYVDHPPFSIAVLALSLRLFGDGLLTLRLPAMIAGAAMVFATGWLAREMGGRRFAHALACLCAIFAPVLLAMGTFFSMNSFDPLFWTVEAWVLVKLLKTGNARWWLIFGLIAGIGLLNKLSLLFLGAALVAALAATCHRKHLISPYLWLGGLFALLLFSPHLVWQVRHGWPTLEFMRNAALYKNEAKAPLEFLFGQFLMSGPVAAPVWLGGLVVGFTGQEGRRFRLLPLLFLIVFLVLLLGHGKEYYLGAAFPMVFALGACGWEQWTAVRRWTRPAYLAVFVLISLCLAPYVLPVLPVPQLLAYFKVVGLEAPREERNEVGLLPQHYADCFGWQDLAAMVADARAALPEQDKERCCVLVANYGEAGALHLFGPKLGVERAVCGHNNHYLWGAGGCSGEVMLVYHFPREQLDQYFGEVREVARFHHPWVMPYQNNIPLYLCREPRVPLPALWPQLKRFI